MPNSTLTGPSGLQKATFNEKLISDLRQEGGRHKAFALNGVSGGIMEANLFCTTYHDRGASRHY